MSTPILATKLYIPPPRPQVVHRPRLIERLNAGLHRKLTLIAAPAGFGKTTLVSEWVDNCDRPTAWLSLGEGDDDPTRFLSYVVAALQTIDATIGQGVWNILQSPQPPPLETILTTLLNEIAAIPDGFVFVFDDYHVVGARPIDDALTFLLEHLPPHVHLVIATREDPRLPLARLRAQGQLTELRAADLRFTADEAAGFLNQAMGLDLSAEDIAVLETRTEGWIAGLQLAALSMQGHQDISGFIHSFTGSHHFVLDYLMEEVLHRQSEDLQNFLLSTSILNRLCGPLCDAVLPDSVTSGQETLEYIQQANLFLVPLDNERRWFRYHHLFADLLRQRLAASRKAGAVTELHIRASQWYEDNGLEVEAFGHAAAANDIDRAERLIEGEGMPLYFRGMVSPVLNWLEGLPAAVMAARPALQVIHASVLTLSGQQVDTIEDKLQAAEGVLGDTPSDDRGRDLIGHIASIRAMLAAPQYRVELVIDQSRRALDYLHPDNLAVRTMASWTLGYAYQLQGERAAASQAYTETVASSQASGNVMVTVAAATCLGIMQEFDNQLHLAAETYQQVVELVGEPPWPTACEAFLGLARIYYQWNDLETALSHGQESARLAPQLENIDTPAASGLFLARLKLAEGDVAGADALLAEADRFARQNDFDIQVRDVAAVQVISLLRQGKLTAAGQLAQAHALPLGQARMYLAQGDPSAALAVLEPERADMESRNWQDEVLRILVLQALAYDANGETDVALQVLGEALAMAAPGGFIRLFVDEGQPMAKLLSEAAVHGGMPDYVGKLLAAFEVEQGLAVVSPRPVVSIAQALVEPLSERELEILQLVADGLSNREISERLFLALSTVKGHNRNIFDKLQVQRRTEAVARARNLGLL